MMTYDGVKPARPFREMIRLLKLPGRIDGASSYIIAWSLAHSWTRFPWFASALNSAYSAFFSGVSHHPG